MQQLHEYIDSLKGMISSLQNQIASMKRSRKSMANAMKSMQDSIDQMNGLAQKMAILRDAVSGAFDTAMDNYLVQIEKAGADIERTFQFTLNGGFKNVYRTTAIAALIAVLLLVFYSKKAERAADSSDAPKALL